MKLVNLFTGQKRLVLENYNSFKNIKATEKYIGRKVGNGICRDLRDSVLMDTKLGTPQIHRKSQILTVGYYRDILSKRKKVYPGDLIEFKDVVTKDMLYPHHVAIVYAKINKDEYFS